MPNARDITVSIQRPELRELARRALAQGFRPGGVRKHGIWLMAPNGEDTVSISHTTGDRRATANTLAELKRFGFKDESEQNGVQRPPTSDPNALKVVEVLVGQNKPMTAQELSAMLGEPWCLAFADRVRHLAESGQIERYGKVTLSGSKLPYRANVYVPKGYTPPVPTAPVSDNLDPKPRPEPPSQPLPPAARRPQERLLIGRVIDAVIALGRPVHMFEVTEYLGEPQSRADVVGTTLSSLSRRGQPHPSYPLGIVRKRDKVQRPGHSKPIVRYEWVEGGGEQTTPAARPVPDEPRTEPQPQPPEPQPSPAPAPDEEVPVAAKPAANETAIEVVRDVQGTPTPTTLLGKPLQFWEDVLRGLAYGLSRTREREGGVG